MNRWIRVVVLLIMIATGFGLLHMEQNNAAMTAFFVAGLIALFI